MLAQIVLSFTFIFIILLLFEKVIYDRRINRFTIRILVNGTRGKSSVTEFITAALNASGYKAIGKITGILPSLILSNGAKRIIKRNNGARVQEQFKVVRYASKQKADALVLECMSVNPELQQLESRTFKPHIYILTNILNDHQEELGCSEKEQAEAICSAIPQNSIVVTNEKLFIELIKSYAASRNTVVHTCDEDEFGVSNIANSIDEENLAIALKVCQILKLDIKKSKEAILKIAADRSLIYNEIIRSGKVIRFINAFAANEPTSTEIILRMFEHQHGAITNKIFILNSRADRPLRTMEFVKWLAATKDILRIYLVGSHSLKAKKELIKSGFNESNLVILKENKPNDFLTDIDNLEYDQITVAGIGNIAQAGLLVSKLFSPSPKLESIRI